MELRVPSCSPRDAARVQRLLNEASDQLRRDLQLLRATLLEAYEEDLDERSLRHKTTEEEEIEEEEMMMMDSVNENVIEMHQSPMPFKSIISS